MSRMEKVINIFYIKLRLYFNFFSPSFSDFYRRYASVWSTSAYSSAGRYFL